MSEAKKRVWDILQREEAAAKQQLAEIEQKRQEAAAELARLNAETERRKQEEEAEERLREEQARKERIATELLTQREAWTPTPPEQEPTTVPRPTLDEDLEGWRIRFKISQKAHDALLAILASHQV